MRDERGSVTLWFLGVVPLLVLVLAFSFELTELTYTANWLQEALNRSAKAAAFQITPESYAVDQPQIDPIRAEDAFRALLAHNLRLDPLTLRPAPNARLREPPVYVLDIYNGPFPFRYVDPAYGLDVVLTEPAAVVKVEASFGAAVTQRPLALRRSAVARVVRTAAP